MEGGAGVAPGAGAPAGARDPAEGAEREARRLEVELRDPGSVPAQAAATYGELLGACVLEVALACHRCACCLHLSFPVRRHYPKRACGGGKGKSGGIFSTTASPGVPNPPLPLLPLTCPLSAARHLHSPASPCSITGWEEAGLTDGDCPGARGAGRVLDVIGERRSGRPGRRRRRGPRCPRPRCRTPTSSGGCTRRWQWKQWSAPAAGARSPPAGSRLTSRSVSGRGARPAAWGTAGTTAGAEVLPLLR